MEKLTALEESVSTLSNEEYASFREWFLNYENERWDAELEKDISNNKLKSFANKALSDFNKGNFRKI